ncbi:MAG: DUF551 domain-containing protein [Colwellia sp.]|nr:DUF551 domain-containing protein [Colwellia sp.]
MELKEIIIAAWEDGNSMAHDCKRSHEIEADKINFLSTHEDEIKELSESNQWISVEDRLPEDESIRLDENYNPVWYAIFDGGTNGVKKGKWYTDLGDGYETEIIVKYYIELQEPPE